MLIFNLLGALMVIVGLAAGFAVGGMTSLFTRDQELPFSLATLVALPVPTVWDLVYRWRHDPGRGWLRYVLPLSGGMFMLMPVWVLCGAWPVVFVSILILRKLLGLH
jgi:hypothetical protein